MQDKDELEKAWEWLSSFTPKQINITKVQKTLVMWSGLVLFLDLLFSYLGGFISAVLPIFLVMTVFYDKPHKMAKRAISRLEDSMKNIDLDGDDEKQEEEQINE